MQMRQQRQRGRCGRHWHERRGRGRTVVVRLQQRTSSTPNAFMKRGVIPPTLCKSCCRRRKQETTKCLQRRPNRYDRERFRRMSQRAPASVGRAGSSIVARLRINKFILTWRTRVQKIMTHCFCVLETKLARGAAAVSALRLAVAWQGVFGGAQLAA